MNFFQNIKNEFQTYKNAKRYKRSLEEFFSMIQNPLYNHEPNFLDGNMAGMQLLPQVTDKYVGTFDVRVSPKDLWEMCNRDAYVMGLFESLVETLFKKDFYVDIMKDEKGNPLGDKKQALIYQDLLKEYNFEELVIKQIYAEWADGGGNSLLFTVKTKKGIEFRCEPFLYNGLPRVRVYGDLKTHIIEKYEVLDERMQVLYTLIPEENLVKQTRYTVAGDFRFSNSPSKRAIFWYILKKNLAGANLQRFKNGLVDPVLMSPDYTSLASLINTMSANASQVSDRSIAEYFRDPLKFISDQSSQDDEILRGIVGRADKASTWIKTHMPYKTERVGNTNVQMQAVELIEVCDAQMGYAYKTSQGIINTQKSKYANAEIERDNWEDLVVDPIKRKMEKVAMEFYLPIIDPEFNPSLYRVRFGRDPDEENLAIYNAKTARNSSKATILSQIYGASISQIVKYNFETDEIEPIEDATVQITENNAEPDAIIENDQTVEDSDKIRVAKKKTIIEDLLKGSEARNFQKIVKNAITKQIKSYTETIRDADVNKLLDNLDKDFKPISNFGLNVSVYKQQVVKFGQRGFEEFIETDKKLKRAPIEYKFPQSIIDMLDAKSQMVIKGYLSLNDEQRKLVLNYYAKSQQAITALKDYQGIDIKTKDEVATIVRNKLANTTITQGAKKDDVVNKTVTADDIIEEVLVRLPDISGNRAINIVNTEIAQSVTATRHNIYIQSGYDLKMWNTCNDDRVRPIHLDNEAQGYISIDEMFAGGEITPADALFCRCDLTYKNSAYEK